MSRIHQQIEKNKWNNDAYMIMQVHDELVFEVRDEIVDDAIHVFSEIMEGVLPKNESRGITLKVDAETGVSWGDMKEL
jgi:DNA polymerase-1